jgi:hypothetical protein
MFVLSPTAWQATLLRQNQRVGMPIRTLDSYIAGEAALDEHVLSRLMKLLGLEYDDGKLLKDGMQRLVLPI